MIRLQARFIYLVGGGDELVLFEADDDDNFISEAWRHVYNLIPDLDWRMRLHLVHIGLAPR